MSRKNVAIRKEGRKGEGKIRKGRKNLTHLKMAFQKVSLFL